MSPKPAAPVNPDVVHAVPPSPPPLPKLLDTIRHATQVRHYSIRTEDAYVDWVRRFVLFHGKRHLRELGAEDVAAFLTLLAVERGVAASTQNQAKSALLFLYRHLLQTDLPWLDEVVAARVNRRLSVVLTHSEVAALLLAVWHVDANAYCGSRMSASSAGRSSLATARVAKIATPCCPRTCPAIAAANLLKPRRFMTQTWHSAMVRSGCRMRLSRQLPRCPANLRLAVGVPERGDLYGPRSGITRCHHLNESSVQKTVGAARRAGIVSRRTARRLRPDG